MSKRLTDMVAQCKGPLRHAWFKSDVPNMVFPPGVTPLSLTCSRCTTQRLDHIDSVNGELVSRHYIYPPGYKYIREATMADWRIRYIASLIKNPRQRKAP